MSVPMHAFVRWNTGQPTFGITGWGDSGDKAHVARFVNEQLGLTARGKAKRKAKPARKATKGGKVKQEVKDEKKSESSSNSELLGDSYYLNFRGIGSRSVRFRIPEDEEVLPLSEIQRAAKSKAAVEVELEMRTVQDAADYVIQQTRAHCKLKKKPDSPPWNPDGEPWILPRSLLTVREILDCVAGKSLDCLEDDAEQWLHALDNYIRPGGKWQVPLIRVLCPVANTTFCPEDGMYTIEFQVYFSRLMFHLIADPVIELVISKLDPVARCQPVESLDSLYPDIKPAIVYRSGKPPTNPFTPAWILHNQESSGYFPYCNKSGGRCTQPKSGSGCDHGKVPGIALSLKEYQAEGLQWMLDMEVLPKGLNGLFWETRKFQTPTSVLNGPASSTLKDEYYYSSKLGELRTEKPGIVRGGLLCDEMGLGKTLQIVSLIKISRSPSHQARYRRLTPPDMKGIASFSKTTLVVVPEHLVSQWTAEIKKSCTEDAQLSVFVYLGQSDAIVYQQHNGVKLARNQFQMANACTSGIFTQYDVVITTYKHVTAKCFATIGWDRVVLDEMQMIRSSTTKIAASCESLVSRSRWMVSGTPLYSSVNDLNGELNFLGVIPFCLRDRTDGFWSVKVDKPMKAQDPAALSILDTLLRSIMIRRSKSQRRIVDGRPLLDDLPPKTKMYKPVALRNISEMVCYAYLESLANICFNATDAFGHLEQGGVAQTTRISGTVADFLRRATISTSLVNGGSGVSSPLRDLNRIQRQVLVLEQGGVGGLTQAVKELPVNKLIIRLLVPQANVGSSSAEASRNRYVSANATGGGASTLAGREMAQLRLDKAQEKLDKATTNAKLGNTSALGGRLPRERWGWVVQAITSGKYGAISILKHGKLMTSDCSPARTPLLASRALKVAVYVKRYFRAEEAAEECEANAKWEEIAMKVKPEPTDDFNEVATVNGDAEEDVDSVVLVNDTKVGSSKSCPVEIIEIDLDDDDDEQVEEETNELNSQAKALLDELHVMWEYKPITEPGDGEDTTSGKSSITIVNQENDRANGNKQGQLNDDVARKDSASEHGKLEHCNANVTSKDNTSEQNCSNSSAQEVKRDFTTVLIDLRPVPEIEKTMRVLHEIVHESPDAKVLWMKLQVVKAKRYAKKMLTQYETMCPTGVSYINLSNHQFAQTLANSMKVYCCVKRPKWYPVRGVKASDKLGETMVQLLDGSWISRPDKDIIVTRRTFDDSFGKVEYPDMGTIMESLKFEKKVQETVEAVINGLSVSEVLDYNKDALFEVFATGKERKSLADASLPKDERAEIEHSVRAKIDRFIKPIIQSAFNSVTDCIGKHNLQSIIRGLFATKCCLDNREVVEIPWLLKSISKLLFGSGECIPFFESAEDEFAKLLQQAQDKEEEESNDTSEKGYISYRACCEVLELHGKVKKMKDLVISNQLAQLGKTKRKVRAKRGKGKKRKTTSDSDSDNSESSDEEEGESDCDEEVSASNDATEAGPSVPTKKASMSNSVTDANPSADVAGGSAHVTEGPAQPEQEQTNSHVVAHASHTSIIRLKNVIDVTVPKVMEGKLLRNDLSTYTKLLSKALLAYSRHSSGTATIPLSVLEQQGMRALQHMADSEYDNFQDDPLSPCCAICLDKLSNPVCTGCVHLFCMECLDQHCVAMTHLQPHVATRKSFPCPLCRQTVRASDLVRVLPPEKQPSLSQLSDVDLETRDFEAAMVSAWRARVEDTLGCTVPRWSSGASKKVYESLSSLITRSERHYSVESLPVRFLGALVDATGVPPLASSHQTCKSKFSSKLAAVIQDIRQVMKEEGGTGKVVVFTQFREAVQHLCSVLQLHNIGCAHLMSGDKQLHIRTAVESFKLNLDIRVLVIHAGVGAAGLTLTRARHVILLEPFLRAGEESQAISRVHRIGQTRAVEARVYYVPGTIEERILAMREAKARIAMDTDVDDDEDGENLAVLLSGETSVDKMSREVIAYLIGQSQEWEPMIGESSHQG